MISCSLVSLRAFPFLFTPARTRALTHSPAVIPTTSSCTLSYPSLSSTGLCTGRSSRSSFGLTKYRTPRRSASRWSGGGTTTRWMLLLRKPLVNISRASATLTVMLPGWGLTHFHSPSGERTCNAATGWRNRRVREPKSVCPFTPGDLSVTGATHSADPRRITDAYSRR